MTVKNQTICAVHEVSDDLNDEDISGILGLAFSIISDTKQPTFFENLLAQEMLPAPVFSVHLTRAHPNGSEVGSSYDDDAGWRSPGTALLRRRRYHEGHRSNLLDPTRVPRQYRASHFVVV